MQDIKELTISDLEEVLEDCKYQKFHAQQIFSWIYQKPIREFAQMSDLPLDLRKRLKEDFYLFGFKLLKKLKAKDKTEKFLFALKDDNLIEAVTIPAEKRITGCISTQVGCKFRCNFCASGLLGFKRNLTSGEMLEEILWLKNESSHKKLTHLVFMGIGEPLDNYDNVIKAIRIINSPLGLNIGARRITISTCGVIPGIKRLSQENLQIELSISLHASDDATRSRIMPVNKVYPLKNLLEACRGYIKKTNRQITFEYLLIKGINSDLPSAQKLVTILADLKLCKVNLIPANTIKECRLEPPEKREVLQFRDYLLKQGLNVTLRRARGEDIAAACGQLRLSYEKA
jgi:23S rRNA (adenine2503-C2)-methyltransferase